MSILASLARAYERLPNAPPFGYSAEKISFAISLNADGSVASVTDLREGEGKKPTPRQVVVPQAIKRAAGIAPNFLWDKTAYVLGVTAGEGKRTAEEHAAFVARHLAALEGTDDPGLQALAAFLKAWRPESFETLGWPAEMKDQNVVFYFEPDRLDHRYLHERLAAQALWRKVSAEGAGDLARCLVSGEVGPVARLHASIKGVWGAQSAGASIVSFNLDAFTSYGHEQGDNAPVSEAAAFAYTTALNRFLERDSGHRLQMGDASVVFWADARAADQKAEAEAAEEQFSSWFDGAIKVDEAVETAKVGDSLGAIKSGEVRKRIDPRLQDGVRFHVLALAPNAARLSVRFYLEDDFGRLAENYRRFLSDTSIDPPSPQGAPPLWRYLIETAVLGKRENIIPNLAGEWLRAILTGSRFPLTLLGLLLVRIRSDQTVNALRAAMLRSVLVRNFNMEAPVSLDLENRNLGYVLGRLFASYEEIQRAALGNKVNATIRDRYYGAASSQPRRVFPQLERGAANHLSKIGKQSPGRKVNLEKDVQSLMELLSPGDAPFPSYLRAEDQGLFALGYYHQRSKYFSPRGDKPQENESK